MQSKTEPHSLAPLLEKLSYRADFSEAEKSAILALPFATRRLERAQFLVREREIATHSCVMLSGYSIRSKLVGSGHRQIVSIHMKGEVVDLQNSMLQTADHSVQMLTESRVAMIPRQAVIDLTLKHPRVGHAMWIDTLVDGSIFSGMDHQHRPPSGQGAAGTPVLRILIATASGRARSGQ